MLLVPLLAFVGTPVLWGLLPFMMGVLALTWVLIERSYADGRLTEVLTLWDDRVELVRFNPRGAEQRWEANPYWVRVEMHGTKGPVENYLTLSGSDRTVEIGAFLSPEERALLYADLTRVIDGNFVPGEPSSVISLMDDVPEIIRKGAGDVSIFQ